MKMTAEKALSMTLRMARGTATAMGLAVMLAVVLGVGTTALAAAPGDPFKLGKVNVVNAVSKLAGTTNDALLKVDNNSTSTGATALDLQVQPGKAPMKVNSDTRVTNLNSDELDGKNASSFAQADTNTYTLTDGAATGLGPTFDPFAENTESCDDGDLALTGGVTSVSDNGQIVASFGFANEFESGWSATVKRIGNENATITFRVTCLDFPPLRP